MKQRSPWIVTSTLIMAFMIVSASMGSLSCSGCPQDNETKNTLHKTTFRASGNEPGWTLTITPERTVFETDYGQFKQSFKTLPPEEQAAGITRYRMSESGHRLEIILRKLPCTDSMSGEHFETTVIAVFDGRPLPGCGGVLR